MGRKSPAGDRGRPARWRRVRDRAGWSAAELGGSASIGLGEDVVLGGATSLVGGDELVLRVRPSPGFTARPLYLRGRIYDRFDGAVWSLAPDDRVVAPAADGAQWLDLVQEGLAADMPLFTTGRVARLEGSEAAAVTVHGAWVLPGSPQRLAYRVWFEPGYESGSGGDMDRWTRLPTLPEPLLEDIADIAPSLEDPWALAVAVREELLARHAYTLAPQVARVDALTAFLVEDLPGHCGYFASAAVVILRSRGVPAPRHGLRGGEWHEATGEYLLRQRHAHAWVEVWDEQGWRRIDVTPGPPRAASRSATAGWPSGSLASGSTRSAGTSRSSVARSAGLVVVGYRLSSQAV